MRCFRSRSPTSLDSMPAIVDDDSRDESLLVELFLDFASLFMLLESMVHVNLKG